MSLKRKFHIPTAQEMESSSDQRIQVKSLFEAHKSKKDTDVQGGSIPTSSTGSGSKSSLNDKHSEQYRGQAGSTEQKRGTEKHSVETLKIVPCSGSDSPSSSTTASQAKVENSVSATKGLTNALIVSTRQRGNPVLKHIRNVLWEFGDIVPDYVMGQTTCALFLSLRYHALNPNYIHERLKLLGHSYVLRVLLVQVDTKDPHVALKQLGKICLLADCTLIVAWSPEEVGRYLETYKAFENKPPDLIMERTETNYLAQLTDAITTVKKVNKTDAMTLLTAFGSFQEIVQASEEDLTLCPGFGPQKARRLKSAFHQPFLKSRTKTTAVTTNPNTEETSSPKKKGPK